jgi:class 3 adenylate cyclase
MGLIALLVAGAITGTDFCFRRAELLGEFQSFVRSVAGTCAVALRGEDVSAIRANADAGGEAFGRVRRVLAKVREINNLAENEIYLLRPVAGSRDPADTEFVCMLQPRTFVGDRYTIPIANQEPYEQAWQERRPAATGVYQDPNGTYISGYAPVLDAAGMPVAIVEVDAEISKFMARQRAALLTSLAIGGAAFVVAMVPGLILARTITRGLNKLTEGIRRFQDGQYDVRVVVQSKDEIQRVGEVFNEMIASVAERLALIPYVSRFTAEAVRKGREDPNWLSGMEQDVVVLFADLRGFTRFSEDREASRVVRELNQLLAVQAEVVISAGGDVDKFVGDRVMAVFLDHEGAGASATALRCARELLERVCEQTTANGWSLSLGVGIHRGRAVVGTIGSAARRDFTAIGHTVNLASRLCDRATPWTVLVSEEVFGELPEQERGTFERREPELFKNVSKPVTTYCCGLGMGEELLGKGRPGG